MVFGHDYVQRSEQALCEDELLIPVTYVRAWVSEAGRDYKYLETQFNILTGYGVRYDLIDQDAGSGRSLKRPGRQ